MTKTDKKNVKTSSRREQMLRKVMSVFHDNQDTVFNYRQISSLLGIKSEAGRRDVNNALTELLEQDFLVETSRGKFRTSARGGYVEGVIDRRGVKTFLLPDDGSEPVFIPERKTNHAMLNDRVRVFLYARRRGYRAEGEVVEIIKRAKDTFVGILECTRHYAFLISDNKFLTTDIFIPHEKLNGALNGQKVLVRLLGWEPNLKNPVGEVIDILGNKGDNNTEMHAILAEFGLPYKYPENVEREADSIDAGITPEETARRIDMRTVPTLTIDPHDAKDFDDALSIRKLPDGLWEVGVHIADVTHYVRPGSIIEREARARATSVYLVDRTIPMLPEHLSNGICSLRPDEDKLTYSVIFRMNGNADITSYEIAKTIIRSNHRFTYEEAQTVIETGEGEMKDEILTLNTLAGILRNRRFSAGAIAFERVEVGFETDEKGKPLSVYFKEAKESNMLIEEFMLLANKTVAQHIGKPGKGQRAKTFVYRIHDVPNQEKLQNLSEFIKRFGYSLKTSGKSKAVSGAINRLLDSVQGKKEQNLIETLAIRSMAKAIYSTENIGHYGLSFEYYTHFTSPIRRYPDMLVHRLLEQYANGDKSAGKAEYEDLCKHSSDMEQIAANAERASIKYKQVEFMSARTGQEFAGVISGVTEWGIYVEITENKCEGMVHIRELDDDYYVFDEKNYCIEGNRYKRRYRLGDEVRVRVIRANLDKKQLDFELV